ncbi:MAG TPA: hypothetical protein VGR10_05220, partial [Thermoleophilaceae bacterium]|nr:hypothetical protein [Thermoleophilaceae bacterium]
MRATRAEPDGPPPDAGPGPTSAVTDAEALLDRLAGALGNGLVLWRGPERRGSDVDLLVTEEAEEDVVSFLHAAGLRPTPGDPGHTVWTGPDTPLDVMGARHWPARYPSLEGLLARAERGPSGPTVASPEDRLLI